MSNVASQDCHAVHVASWKCHAGRLRGILIMPRMCGHVARLEAEADRAGGFYTYCKLEAIPEPNKNESDDEDEKTEEIW